METNPRAQLDEIDRLRAEARRATHATPPAAVIFLIVVEIGFLAVYAAGGWSLPWPVIVGWLVFVVAFEGWLRSRRKARAPMPWATPESRRSALLNGAATVAANAVFIPLWMWSRWVAVAALFAVLLVALAQNLRYARTNHA